MSESKGFLSRFKPMSPKITRRYAPLIPNTKQDDNTKVTQNEVEEKLRAMRQKRLSRLNIFVADQVQLSEGRSCDNNIEEAIVSIKKLETESMGVSSKATPENSNDNDSYKKTSSAKKFINKLSCVNHNLTISCDDLTSVEPTNTSRHSIPTNSNDIQQETNRSDLEMPSDNHKANKIHFQIKTNKEVIPELPPRSLKHRVFGRVATPLKNVNIPTEQPGNNLQRKPSYELGSKPKVISNSCEETPKLDLTTISDGTKKIVADNSAKATTFGQIGNQYFTTDIQIKSNEDGGSLKSPTRSFSHRTFGKTESLEKRVDNQNEIGDGVLKIPPKIFTYETFVKSNTEDNSSNELSSPNRISNSNIAKNSVKLARNSYENVILSTSKPEAKIKISEIEKSTANDRITDNKSMHQKIHSSNASKPYENVNFERDVSVIVDKNVNSSKETPRSPLPLPRMTNQDEKVLRKFHSSYLTLHEILENDAKVDQDELEDFKTTFHDAAKILNDYKLKLNQLETKVVHSDKLEIIRKKTNIVRNSLMTFRGLKRDVAYLDMSNKLSSYFFEIKNDSSKGVTEEQEKKLLLGEVDECIKDLETKVTRNEKILHQVLEDQVLLIMTKRLIPTIV